MLFVRRVSVVAETVGSRRGRGAVIGQDKWAGYRPRHLVRPW